ncbi:MAG: nicotinate-nucleotide adenylyltransferase [Parasporobacterium sp.]|nr:nicotinate-nucleotide adenylyltransferase [Parasporobacterium sp.]
MKKIGILGGTFDPIHNAHIIFSEAAYDQLNLDEMLIMPSPNPPHKDKNKITDLNDRVAMIKLALEEHPKLIFSDFELKREGKVYTYETLKLFKEQHPDCELYFLVGEDSLYNIDNWYRPEEIFANCKIVTSIRDLKEYDSNNKNAAEYVKERESKSFEEEIANHKKRFNAEIIVLKLGNIDISATKVRERAKAGEDICDLLPKKVAEYIINNKIYG